MNATVNHALLAIGSTVALSYAYFLVLDRIAGKGGEGDRKALLGRYMTRKSTGVILLGVIPVLICFLLPAISLRDTGLCWDPQGRSWAWFILAVPAIVLINRFNAASPEIRSNYPELRLHHWDPASWGLLALGWTAYLIAYEYLFRGLLLFTCMHAFGTWAAVVINVALYSSLHLHKGLKEAAAAVPFGVLLSLSAILSGSIIPAIVLHSVQAISCDTWCLIKNHEMSFSIQKPLQS